MLYYIDISEIIGIIYSASDSAKRGGPFLDLDTSTKRHQIAHSSTTRVCHHGATTQDTHQSITKTKRKRSV